ncbi:MAG TPA: DUF481 domain-containing protein [Vicinamibacterales bacterium]|nr:DUF481 domain-containing protein [Vicinamibacterales bacterium]
MALLTTVAAAARAQPPAPPQTPAERQMPRVFLDCNRCDHEYIRKEVTFVDYVRNREDADVHVLVTLQDTGGGGRQWTLKYIGLGEHQGIDLSLTYNSPQTATPDEVRAGFVEVFKRGLVRYALSTAVGRRLQVTLKKAGEAEEAKPAGGGDPWNFWVYQVSGNGNFNGEESSKGRSISVSFDANRTTDAWRTSIDVGARYRDTRFVLDDDEEEGSRRTFLSIRRDMEASGILVRSLTQHWSLGMIGSAESQTFRNFTANTRFAPGIEYNFFPYSESTRRMLTVQYTIGHVYHRYREETIFGKLRDQLIDQRAEVGLSMRQPWGSANAELKFDQYLTDPSKYSLGLEGGANIRVFKGFSINFYGEFSRTRDQIYLPRGEASTEEILLRQRQLLTGYQYYMNFGFSYTFGSIFNNIVNPRFGGGG